VIDARRVGPEPFFADTPRGRRFAVVNRPSGPPQGSILFIPPFAEEMNKSRRMAALTATALAGDGWLVLRFDPHGCGDSEGDFADATWEGWLEDLSCLTEWLKDETGGPLVLWGLRAGALLANAWAVRTPESPPLMLWQPVLSGQRHLTQFLRLRAAAEMMDSSGSRGIVARLRETLRDGSAVTVAGYTLNPALANPMSETSLSLPDQYSARVAVLEISRADSPALTPATENLVRKWSATGIELAASAVPGPPFWQTTEIETAPAAIHATVKAARNLVR
jgi:exosortase A-associated hydrolase 2